MAHLEDVLVPTYLMHRYQVQAAATKLGGSTSPMRCGRWAAHVEAGGGRRTKNCARQHAGYRLARHTDVANRAGSIDPPRPPQSGVSRELFPRETGYVFDPAAAAATAAQLTVGELLDPRRAARLNNQTMVSGTLPDFAEVLREGRAHIWAEQSNGALGIMERRVQLTGSMNWVCW